jgi:putative SOS response-associated peptidase YedK
VCYSNSSTSKNIDLARKFKKKIPENSTYITYYHSSGFSHPLWPIVTSSEEIQFMNWGLIPNWYKGNFLEIAAKTLNCRTETADTRSSFKHLINSRRCIIPSSGFFEWQHLGKEKIPFFIYPRETDILSMAGLWDTSVNLVTGEINQTFTILTTEANDFMGKIHNTKKRMPLFLNSDNQISEWLSNCSNISHIIKSSQQTLLLAHEVNKNLLLSSQSNVPEVNQPFQLKPNQLSLF